MKTDVLGEASNTTKGQLLDSDMLGDISEHDSPGRESRDRSPSQSNGRSNHSSDSTTPNQGPRVIGLITEWISSVSFIKGINNSVPTTQDTQHLTTTTNATNTQNAPPGVHQSNQRLFFSKILHLALVLRTAHRRLKQLNSRWQITYRFS